MRLLHESMNRTRIFSNSLILMVTAVASMSNAQKSMESLPRKEKAALALYLKGHKTYELLTESHFSTDAMKDLRTAIKGFHPYYISDDFTDDGRRDFAVVIAQHSGLSTENFHATFLLIFNGTKHGYKLAYSEEGNFDEGRYITFEKPAIGYLGYAADTGVYLYWRHKRYVAEPEDTIH